MAERRLHHLLAFQIVATTPQEKVGMSPKENLRGKIKLDRFFQSLVSTTREVEKQPPRFAGIRSTTPYESQQVRADDSRKRKFTGHLTIYYDALITCIRDAEAILIFGPGEAKGELQKRIKKSNLGGRIVGIETIDKMSDRQIAAKGRQYFQVKSAR